MRVPDNRGENEGMLSISVAGNNRLNMLSVGSQNNEVILVWPPPPQREAVSVLASDLDLLEPEEFLNDTIIDFYLKFVLSWLYR